MKFAGCNTVQGLHCLCIFPWALRKSMCARWVYYIFHQQCTKYIAALSAIIWMSHRCWKQNSHNVCPVCKSYPQSNLSLPCFTFWNCFSYHSRSATVHTCTFPDSRSDSRFSANGLIRSRPSLLLQVPFILDPHESVNLSSPCSTVATWKNKGWQRGREAEGWMERELRGLPKWWRLSAPI